MTEAPPRAPMYSADLDDETLEALYRDLSASAEVLDITLRLGPGGMLSEADAPARLTLEEALRLLQTGKVKGVRVRYRAEEAQWEDTLLAQPGSIRLVRIRQDLG